MKTLYAACLSRLGLSRAQAATLHGEVRLDTIKAWSADRSKVPAGVWDDLRAAEARIRAGHAEQDDPLHLISQAHAVLPSNPQS